MLQAAVTVQNFAEIVDIVEHVTINDNSGGGRLRHRLNDPTARQSFIATLLPQHISKHVLKPASRAKTNMVAETIAKYKDDPRTHQDIEARYSQSEGTVGGVDGEGESKAHRGNEPTEVPPHLTLAMGFPPGMCHAASSASLSSNVGASHVATCTLHTGG
jgi:hypothetical protein